MRSLNIYFRHFLLPSGQSSGVFYSIISFCFLIQRLVVSNSCTGPPYISFTKLQGLASAALCCNSLPCSMRISWQIAPNPSTFSCVMPMFLLFSAHISYGKGKYLNQTGFFFFFLQNLPRFYLYLNLRVLPIEFNPHKFSFVRYVFVEIFEVFLKNDENDPLMTK